MNAGVNVTAAAVREFRASRRRLDDGRRVSSDQDAAAFVEQRGIAALAPMSLGTVSVPSLSEADAREPWEGYEITDGAWRWKETLPASRACAYGKLLKGRGTFASWKLFRLFYAVHRCQPDPAAHRYQPEPVDYADLWDSGMLSRTEKTVIDLIADHGPIPTDRLWKYVVRALGCKRSSFIGAMTSLQAGVFITVSGGSLEGWSMHHWDLVERQAPPEALADLPGLPEARAGLLDNIAANSGACSLASCAAILGGWPSEAIQAAAAALEEAGRLRPVTVVEDDAGRDRLGTRARMWATPELLDFYMTLSTR